MPSLPNNKTEDIFADLDTKTVAPRPNRPEQMVKYSSESESPHIPSPRTKLKVGIGLFILVVVLITVIIVMIFRFGLFSPRENNQLEIATEVLTVNEDKDTEPVLIETDTQGSVDSDQDGLSDEEELILMTNTQKYDTDSDGLSDYDEAKIYGTDPVDSDSDGDGYIDGEEIKGGYNPLGDGKLLNFQEALNKLKKQ